MILPAAPGNAGRFDTILCDIMMPGMTGIDFYERLAPAVGPAVKSGRPTARVVSTGTR